MQLLVFAASIVVVATTTITSGLRLFVNIQTIFQHFFKLLRQKPNFNIGFLFL